jgi:hypothetical protein
MVARAEFHVNTNVRHYGTARRLITIMSDRNHPTQKSTGRGRKNRAPCQEQVIPGPSPLDRVWRTEECAFGGDARARRASWRRLRRGGSRQARRWPRRGSDPAGSFLTYVRSQSYDRDMGKRFNASQLRKDVYRILDEVLETGRPVEIERKGRVLRIEPQREERDVFGLLTPHPGSIVGDAEDLVHIDWSSEWKTDLS